MSIQEQLAPYLNQFVILFHQNASAKLELSCTNGKVSVNIMHDFGVVEKTVPPKKPDQQPYNEVLKKNLKPSQINILQKRASARAEQAKHQNESIGKSIQEANKSAADAANMKKAADKALAEAEILKKEAEQVKAEGEKLVEEAEKAKSETESAKSELNKSSFKNKCDHCDFKYNSTTDISMHINEVHNYPCSICSFNARTQSILQGHWTLGYHNDGEEVFCEFCGVADSTCQQIFKHIEKHHKRNRFRKYANPYS